MKNNFKIVGILSLIIIFNFCFSQTINYKVDNKTTNLAPFKLGASLWFASGLQTSIGVTAQGWIANKLFYNVEYRHGIARGYSNLGFVGKEELQTTHKEIKPNSLEIGVAYSFFEKKSTSKFKIVTDKSLYTETSFLANCDVRKLVTIGGGVFTNNYVYYLPNDSLAYFESNSIKLQPQKDMFYHTNISTLGFYGGISFKKIKKAAVSADGYRYRKFKSTSWNFDLISGYAKAGAIELKGGNYNIDNSKPSPLGYRIAFKADQGPTSVSVEIGKFPCLKFTSPGSHPDLSLFGTEGIHTFLNFFRLGFNIILFGNDRRFALKQKSTK
jgi:hypothetical protein